MHSKNLFVSALLPSLASGIGQATSRDSRASHPDAHPTRVERGASRLEAKGFTLKDHEDLAKLCKRLNDRNVYWMVSNSDSPLVNDLFVGFKINYVETQRSISCKGDKRGSVLETITCNY